LGEVVAGGAIGAGDGVEHCGDDEFIL
jgi:hypothetical protein